MTDRGAPRARRLPVVPSEPLLADVRFDYADAFEIRGHGPDPRSAEQFARSALEQAPAAVRWVVRTAQQRLLGLRLAPSTSAHHVLGWTIVRSQPDVLLLEAWSPLLGRAVIVGRRADPTSTVLTTFVSYGRPVASRIVWTLVGPLHRRVAPYLLERATEPVLRSPCRPPSRTRPGRTRA